MVPEAPLSPIGPNLFPLCFLLVCVAELTVGNVGVVCTLGNDITVGNVGVVFRVGDDVSVDCILLTMSLGLILF